MLPTLATCSPMLWFPITLHLSRLGTWGLGLAEGVSQSWAGELGLWRHGSRGGGVRGLKVERERVESFEKKDYFLIQAGIKNYYFLALSYSAQP